MLKLIRVALILLFAIPLFAQQKQPWEWTTDERLADRFDPQKIHERQEAYVERFPQLRSHPEPPLSPGETRYGIDGARNPELFLPHELFQFLLQAFNGDPEQQAKQMRYFAPRLIKAGFDPQTFWPALQSVSSEYLALREIASHSSAESAEKCRARFAALDAARGMFGAERFDRMLYTAVAPGTALGAGSLSRDPAQQLRWEADGCRGPEPR